MNKATLAVWLLLMSVVASSTLAEQVEGPQIHPLHAKRHEVLRMSGILRDLALAAGSTEDFAIAREMHHVAERCAEYLDVAEALLKLDESMQDPTDRLRTAFALQLRLLIYITELDARIREVNVGLANASGGNSKKGIPSAALTLLDRTAEAKDLLKDLEAETKSRLKAMTKS